jgi:hypothetical protein
MNIKSTIVSCTFLLCSLTPSLASQPSVGVLACGHGKHPDAITCGPGPCGATEGAVLLTGAYTCPAGYYYTVGTAVGTYIQGVCGDQSAALPGYPTNTVPCDGHFVMRIEACTVPSTFATEGSIRSQRAWGRYRVCYDSSPIPTGDCSGAVPVGVVISEGSELGFGSDILGSPWMETTDVRRTSQSTFSFNGVPNANMSFRIGVGRYTSEAVGGSCPVGGCGIEGCITKLK